MDIDSDRLSTCSTESKSRESKSFNYVFKSMVKQEEYEHANNKQNSGESVLYGVQMNPYLQNQQFVFAAVGQRRATVYECEANGSIKLKQTYLDSSKTENFFCCCWSYSLGASKNQEQDHLLILAGQLGIIRIISIRHMICSKTLRGHGNSINELKTHPKDQNLILSASKDHSIRLWNIYTETCVAIFSGIEGHRDEVLSADFHLSTTCIISAGMDHALKIWKLDTPKMKRAIKDSYYYDYHNTRQPFKIAKDTFPVFTTRNIHRNYVDSVSWYGNFVLSKSCENAIVLWKPGKLECADDIELSMMNNYSTDQTATILHKFECKNNDIWFIRLSLDERKRFLSVGNLIGVVYVWKLDEEDPTKSKFITLNHPKCYNKTIRQTCFSLDGRILIAVSDDGSIFMWHLEENFK